MSDNVRVAVNGYGVIGKRVADAVRAQPDMELIGVSDITTDYRIQDRCPRTDSIVDETEGRDARRRLHR